MVFDRYAHIRSLPGPEGKARRPFRVDEDWNVIYLDEDNDAAQPEDPKNIGQGAGAGILSWDDLDRTHADELKVIGRLGQETPIQVAELGNSGWNGYDVMRSQGQRDGQSLKTVPNPDAATPANGRYEIPEGTKVWAGDKSGRLVLNTQGEIIKNPNYQKVIDATKINKVGVVKDLALAGGGVGFALRKGAMALGAAQLMPVTTGAKQAYELEKMRRSQKREK